METDRQKREEGRGCRAKAEISFTSKATPHVGQKAAFYVAAISNPSDGEIPRPEALRNHSTPLVVFPSKDSLRLLQQ